MGSPHCSPAPHNTYLSLGHLQRRTLDPLDSTMQYTVRPRSPVVTITYSSPSLTHSTSTPLGMLLVHQGSLFLPHLLPHTLPPWWPKPHPLSSSFWPVTHLVRHSEVCHTGVTITLDLTHCVVHVYLPTFMEVGSCSSLDALCL